MATGTIKWLNTKQKFGFIKPDNSIDEFMLHISELEKAGFTLIDKLALDGLRVNFDVGINEHNKPAAINIKFVTDKVSRIKFARIKWFNVEKRYGFISPKDGGRDVFLHSLELEKAKINPVAKKNLLGAFISYELCVDTRNRKSAINICFLARR